MNPFARLWAGRVPLPITFWVFGFLVNVAMAFVLGALALSNPQTARALTYVYLVYYLFIVVAIWRSSERYTGPKVWAALARIMVILGVLRTIVTLVAGS
jgi:hypothetical protein